VTLTPKLTGNFSVPKETTLSFSRIKIIIIIIIMMMMMMMMMMIIIISSIY
jgi:hypothetical protein